MTRIADTLARVRVDWVAFGSALALSCLGLLTMNSFIAEDPFFLRQSLWLLVSVTAFFVVSSFDWRIVRRSGVAVSIYAIACGLLLLLVLIGQTVKGAQSWLTVGFAAFQPAELAKLALIVVLAKYFSRRHIEIRNFRHIIVSGAYAALLFVIVALQPDFGSAIIIFLIWLGMVLVSGISRKHLLAVFALGLVVFGGLWLFGFRDYQKERIVSFLHPLADIQGAGYNAYQSTVAVGSGELFGKGIGYGTQSKLRYLPEYQTDFIFAAYAEEWGFVGVVLLFALYGTLFFRILAISRRGATNFETLFAMGVLFYFSAHFLLHVGINLGLLPVTGTTIPFMSYGGSHLLVEFVSLGILCGQASYGRVGGREVQVAAAEWSGGYDGVKRAN